MKKFIEMIREGFAGVIGAIVGKSTASYAYLAIIVVAIFTIIYELTGIFSVMLETLIYNVSSEEFVMVFFALLPDNWSTCLAAYTTSNVMYVLFRFKFTMMTAFESKL